MWKLMVLLLIPLLACADEPHPTLALGSPAPEFSLPGIDGKTHTLKDYAGSKVLAIVFTCNHCPTAQLYETRIKKLADDYRNRDVTLVAIQPNNPDAIRLDELGYTDVSDSFEDMKIRAEYRHFNFPYLYDGDKQAAANAYGPKATPHVFIFDRERKLRYEGRVDNNQRESLVKTQDARNAIDALLADKPVPVAHTGVFGCSTKWISKQASRLEELKKIETEPVRLETASLDDLKKLRSNGTGKVLLVNFWARRTRRRDEDAPAISCLQPEFAFRVDRYLRHASCIQPKVGIGRALYGFDWAGRKDSVRRARRIEHSEAAAGGPG
jgi:peroxiredoxin